MISTVYVEQYGYFWKFTRQGFVDFLTRAIAADGCFDLDDGGRRLKGKPGHVAGTGRHLFTTRNHVALYLILDYDLCELVALCDSLSE